MKCGLVKNGYMAVRKSCDDGHEWLDMESLACILPLCEMQARGLDQNIPTFAKDNPVVRFVGIEIKEVVI